MALDSYRHTKRLPIDLFVNKFIGDEPFACRTRDLSTDGIYLHKLIEPARGLDDNLVGLEFALPGSSEVIWACGEIVREENRDLEGVAVKFIAMAERHKQLLVDFIEHSGGWVVQAA